MNDSRFGDYLRETYGSVYAFVKQCEEHNAEISAPYIYKLANGYYGNLTIKMLCALSHELNLTPSQVLELFSIDSNSVM